jgi:hypothetical protein
VGNERRGVRADRLYNRAPSFEAVVATVANDDVLEYLHAEQRAGINEATGQLDVVGAGARIAGGMVVRLMCPESLYGGAQAPR